jgi:hypothetical protein
MAVPKQDDANHALVVFITQFISLLHGQIIGIKEEMATIVEEVMASVTSLNTTQAQKTRAATSILLKKEGNGEGFQEVSSSEKNQSEEEILKESQTKIDQLITTNVKTAGQHLKEHMQELKTLDETIESLMLTTIGVMSADDVIGQRLDHVTYALDLLGERLGHLMDHMDTQFTPQAIEAFGKQINQDVFRKYTMAEERDCFIKIQGYTPQKNKTKN